MEEEVDPNMQSPLSSSPNSPSRLNRLNAVSSFPTTTDVFTRNDERSHTPEVLTPQDSSDKLQEQWQQDTGSGDAEEDDDFDDSSISFGEVFVVFLFLLSN